MDCMWGTLLNLWTLGMSIINFTLFWLFSRKVEGTACMNMIGETSRMMHWVSNSVYTNLSICKSQFNYMSKIQHKRTVQMRRLFTPNTFCCFYIQVSFVFSAEHYQSFFKFSLPCTRTRGSTLIGWNRYIFYKEIDLNVWTTFILDFSVQFCLSKFLVF